MATAPMILDIPGAGKAERGSEGMVIAQFLWPKAILKSQWHKWQCWL